MYDTNSILKSINAYYQSSINDLIKVARIKKMPNGKYRVESLKGKNLGESDSYESAVKRLQQVEFFKNQDVSNVDDEKIIDLTGAVDFAFSAIMREMRKNASKEQVREFLISFKKEFDKAVKSKNQKPEKIALQNSLVKFNKKHKVKCKKKLVKNAAVSELGDPVQVGKYLADIVRFTLNRISLDKRQNAINSLKNKFYSFNANEISQKEMPPTSAIGQSITFVKHVLFNQNSEYVRTVLNNIVSNL